ncbi:MAG: DUF2188 domain-containing protein [Cytophagaceae bacterium]
MKKKKIYHVNYSLNGWRAQPENSDTIVCDGERKSEVINCIREKAKNDGNAQVIIHSRDGRILKEKTFGTDLEDRGN